MLTIQAGLVILCFIFLSTTETFFIRSRTAPDPAYYEPLVRRSFRVRSPGLGRTRTRFLQMDELPIGAEENELSGDSQAVDKRAIFRDQGVVFPWNEWKCQVRGCRKRG